MKALLCTVLAVLLCLMGSISSAQDPSSTSVSMHYVLPVVPTTTNPQGEEMKCLTPKQWKIIVLIANEYNGLRDWRLKTEGTLKTYTQMVQEYELLLKNQKQIIKFQEQDREYLKLRLDQELKASKNANFSNSLEKYGLWAIVVIETLTIGILGARMAIVNQ